MRRRIRTLSAVLVAAASIVLVAGQLPASATGIVQGVVPSAVPGLTPHILDNPNTSGPAYNVLDMAQVGNRIVVGGQFTQVKNPASAANGGGPTGSALTRNNIFAFDPSTGQVDPNFAPSVTGGIVSAVAAGPTLSTGPTVYIGGSFNTIGTTTFHRLALLNLADGSIVTTFNPSRWASLPNAAVQDIQYDATHNRLFLAGSFTSLGTRPHGGLATVNATTGAEDPYMNLNVAGHHNYNGTGAQAPVGAVKIDINPAGDRMIAIGNFKTVNGLLRDQAVSISLGSTGVAVDSWTAQGYQAPCKKSAFDSWVRDVQWSPDGSYFVIDGTGAYGPPPSPATSPPQNTPAPLCDTAARFNATDMGTQVNPYWIAYSGGDSFFSVAITDQAVYVAGHPRWMNNPLAGDNAAPGAVPRPGIAALDPLNGLPLSWNPGRNPRGAPLGAQSLLATPAGIYVGSDTNTIGSPNLKTYTRMKLAFFPLAGGAATPSQATGTLPGTFYLAGVGGVAGAGGTNSVVSRTSDGTARGTSGDTALTNLGGTTWTNARGAFMVGNQLFYGIKDPSSGTFMMARRTFTNGTFGAEEILNTPYKDPVWDGVSTGTTNGGLVYDGVYPNFYGPYSYKNTLGSTVNVAGDLSAVTGMFYWNGRVYYTKSGSSSLFYRYFSVDRGVVGAQFFTAASSGFSGTGGMFLNGNNLYVVNSSGNLTQRSFLSGVPSATSTVVDSTHNWKADALWFDSSGSTPPPPPNTPPTPQLSASCTGMTCLFDASGSTDSDGDTLLYSWNFGDGSATTGQSSSPTTSYTYATAQTYTATVTVDDQHGNTATATASVNPSSTATTGNIAFRAASQAATNGGSSISVSVPSGVQSGDALILIVTNNGGSTLSTAGVTATPPTGWTQVGLTDSLVSATNSNVAMRGQVFVKVASAGDLGSNVAVTLSGGAKANAQLIAYSGAVGANPVRSATGAGQPGGATHTTPSSTATAGDWVLSVWSDKVGAISSWTAPSGEAARSTITSTGTSGEISSLAGDPGAPVATTGTVAGLAATPTAADSKAVVWTVVIAGS